MIVQIIEMIKYHFWFLSVYFVFNYDSWKFRNIDINIDYELINNMIYIYIVILSLYTPFMINMMHYFIYIFYLFVMVIIYNIGKNKQYFFIGLSSILFLTEWYELPIYIHNGFNWFTLSGLVVIFKLLMIFYTIKIIKDLNLNYIMFIGSMFIFSIFYIFLGIVFYHPNVWIYRASCALAIVLFIYGEKVVYNVKMSVR